MLPSKLKSICDVQEVENFQWYLEKYFEFNRLKRDENKIKYVNRWDCVQSQIYVYGGTEEWNLKQVA